MALHQLAHRPRLYFEGSVDLPNIASRRPTPTDFTIPGAKPDMFFVARLVNEPHENIVCLSAGCAVVDSVRVVFFNVGGNNVNLGPRAITIIAL